MSVLIKYLMESTNDSLSTATLEWGEFNNITGGEYEPFSVAPQGQPGVSLDVEEETSTFSGSIELISTSEITSELVSQNQDVD